MANFGMIDRSVAFNPISAFPLDARSYFESYADALAAAQIASTVGDTNTQYYFGETVVVVENGAAQLYIIQPDKTLVEVGSKVVVDENAFELDENGTLKLLGLAEAEEGAQLVKSKDGSLIWVKPDTTTVDGLAGAVETLEEELGKTNAAIDEANAEIEKLNQALNPTDEEGNPVEGGLVADVENLETEVSDIQEDIVDINDSITNIESKIGDPANSELGQEATGLYAALDLKADKATTYTKTEVATLIEEKIVAANHLRRIIVDSKDDIDENADDALLYIYMAPSGLEEDDNKYYEYIVLEAEDGSRSVERVGSWEVNLDDYALKTEVSNLADTVAANKKAAEDAIAAEQARAELAEKVNSDAIIAEKERAEQAENDLAQDIIDAVAVEKARAEQAEQDLADELADLDEAKANKNDVYTKEEVYTKSKTVTEILAQIDKVNENVGESAGAVLSKLEAYQKVVNTEIWGDEAGSGDENGNSRLDIVISNVAALSGAEANFISSVDETELKVEDKKLSIITIDGTKINNLENHDTIIAISNGVSTNANEISTLKTQVQTNTNNISTISINVENLSSRLSDFVLMTQYEADLGELKDILTWKEMT